MSIGINRAAIAALVASGLCNVAGATECPADLDQNGVVNGADLAQLIQAWGASDGFGDLTGDGMVDGGDLGALLLSWGACPGICPTEFAWQPGFEQTEIAFWGTGVYALEAFDDGRGKALYAGGWFNRAGGPGGVAATNIAKWDGLAWTALGSGLDGPVDALAVFDDGTGPALYAGGRFTTAGGVEANRIAKWDGTEWTPLGSGMSDTVWALAVFDDGTGPALYAGGDFTTAGGVEANHIAKWDGAEWRPLGSGLSGAGSYVVLALTVFDDGTGPALYAGGDFTTAGDSPVNRVAKWDGTAWAAVGSGPEMGAVWGLATVAGPEGPELVAGGSFENSPYCNLQRWNGESWSVLGECVNGTSNGSYCSGCIQSLAGCWSIVSLYTPVAPGFPELLIGGGSCGGIGWSQDGFVDLSGGLGITGSAAPPFPLVFAWEAFDDGSGTKIYAGGPFLTAGGQPVRGVAAWDGDTWFDVGGGVEFEGEIELGLNNDASALAVFNDSTGPALYAGGGFTTAGGIEVNRIARWDGTDWHPLGSGMNDWVSTLTVFDDGSGPALYAGGSFTTAGGVEANRVAKWDGTQWTPLGSGMNEGVRTLAVFDDGSGPALYAGGNFTTAGGVEANRIAKWDGAEWSPLGSGMSGSVRTLAVFDDGSGPALYGGGHFTSAGGVPTNYIARWDGTVWTPLGIGMSSSVLTLTAFDDGTGPALYAGGFFITAGGLEANRIAKWDGTEWISLGSGMSNNWVSTLTVFDNGTGPALYAGGSFTSAGGVPANYIARWDGTAWTPLGIGMSSRVRSLSAFDDGTGAALYAGGLFTAAGGILSGHIAKWGCSPLGVRGWYGHANAEATTGGTDHDEFARPMALMPIGVDSARPSLRRR